MKKLASLLSLLGLCTILLGQSNCRNLFISEYIEGNGSDRAIEIYNPSMFPIDLDLNKVRLYKSMDGGASTDTLFLSGTIDSFGTFVICDTGAATAITSAANTITSRLNHDGNDAYILYSGEDDTLDVFGVGGQNPGASWTVTGGTTANQTLVRQAGITSGGKDWSTVSTEWDVYASGFTDSIGAHMDTAASISDSLTCLRVVQSPNFTVVYIEQNPPYALRLISFANSTDSATVKMRMRNNAPGLAADFPGDYTMSDTIVGFSPNDSIAVVTLDVIDDTIQESGEWIVWELFECDHCLIGPSRDFDMSVGASDSIANCSYLYFSEYVESSGFGSERALEIYNPQPFPVDLSDYELRTHNNGSFTANYTFNPTGTIQAYSTYVIANPNANDPTITAAADVDDLITQYSGNDVIWLLHTPSGHLVDVIGDIGQGSNFSTQGGTSLSNNTIQRNPDVYHGDPAWLPTSYGEWSGLGQNFYDSLGTHYQNVCFSDPYLLFSMDSFSALEEDDTFSVDVQLSFNPQDTVEAIVSFVPGSSSATELTDFGYTDLNDTLRWLPGGSLNQPFNFYFVEEFLQEGDEYAVFSMSRVRGPANMLGDSTLVVGILDDDSNVPTRFSFVLDSSSFIESDGSIQLEVEVDIPGSDTCTIGFIRQPASAADSGADFAAQIGSLTFQPFSTNSQFFTIDIVDDFLIEGDEIASLQLVALSGNITFGDDEHHMSIVDNDFPVEAQLSFQNATADVREDAGTLNIPVQVDIAGDDPSVVGVTVLVTSTASNPADFSWTVDSLVIPAQNSTTRNLQISIVDDAIVEGVEQIELQLTDRSGNLRFGNDQTTVRILDNESPTVYMVDATRTTSESAGSVSIEVGILDGNAAATSVDVEVLAGGTASSISDYSFSSTTLTFPGSSSANESASVTILDDAAYEVPEILQLVLRNPTNGAQLGDTITVLTITDDDIPAAGFCDELLFSEYMEGTGNEKALEIYNPTDQAIDLDNVYSIVRYSNGGGTGVDIDLTGTIAAGQTFVISADAASAGLLTAADQTSSLINHDGNDAYELRNGSTVIDMIGVPGVDPGPGGWSIGGGFSTEDNSLRRRADVYQGGNWNPSEWIGYPLNDISGFGQHDDLNCDASVGIGPNLRIPGLSVYPNPAEDVVYINSPLELDDWKLLDVQGRVLQAQQLDGQLRIEIPLEGIADGIYLIRYERDGKWGQERLIKR